MYRLKFLSLVAQTASLLGLLQAAPTGATPPRRPTAPAAATMPAPAKPMALRDNPLLQEMFSVEATNRALGDTLANLSHTLKVDLTASPQTADQRVTLHLTDQPLYLLMERLPALLSHLPNKSHGYYWERLDRPVGTRPAFNLWRDLRSVQDEEHEQGYPRREAAVMLRDMRNLCRLTNKERESYKGDFPFIRFPGISPTEDGPEGRALRDLTDAQIDALLDGEKVALDPTLFPEEIAAFKKQRRENYLRIHHIPSGEAASVPALPDIPPALSVSIADGGGNDPAGEMRYHLNLEGIVNYSSNIDVYDTSAHPDPSRVSPVAAASADKGAPSVDMAPFLNDKTVTPEQRGSLSFTVQALAKSAHVNIYCETFLKGPYVAYLPKVGGLTTLKGTLPSLIGAICTEWNYQGQKVGDDYFLWSRTWAMDRAADVPDRLISRWRTRQQKQGALTLTDDKEIAATLTWPQIALTLAPAVPGVRMGNSDYKALRLLGMLSPLENDAAFSPSGLSLAESAPWVQQAFADEIQRQTAQAQEQFLTDDNASVELKQRPVQLTSDQYAQAVLTMRADEADAANQTYWLDVSAGGTCLIHRWLSVSLPPAKPATALPAASPLPMGSAQPPGP